MSTCKYIVNISIRDDDMKPFSRNELARWRVGITSDLFFSSTSTRESSKVALSGYEFAVFDKNKFATCEIKTWKLNQAQQIIDWVTLSLLLFASDRCFCTIRNMNVAVSQPESLVNHSFFPIDRVADLHNKSSPKIINWWEKGQKREDSLKCCASNYVICTHNPSSLVVITTHRSNARPSAHTTATQPRLFLVRRYRYFVGIW